MAFPQGPLPRGSYNDHTQSQYYITTAQLALLIIWVVAILYSIFSIFFGDIFTKHLRPYISTLEVKSTELGEPAATGNISDTINGRNRKDSSTIVTVKPDETTGDKSNDISAESCQQQHQTATKTPQAPSFVSCARNIVFFGVIMLYFYLADYRKVFPPMNRTYNEDLFLFLVILLFLVGMGFTIKPTKDKILNRDQTEEWKGWMQVLFVWYHYFAAKSWYNWIRIYIAAYVWMTGFGNFSFFWIRQDYSLLRMLKMLFRLNFLVIIVCNVLDNPYMLYYICAMHTYWFLTVYACMAVLPSWNTHGFKMAAKFIAYALCNAILFEVPGLHMEVFRPFSCILGFPDGKHDVMHEWAFRSGLDHWACFIGMLCAYNYPYFEMFINYLESNSDTMKNRVLKIIYKAALVVALLGLFWIWYVHVLSRGKYEYNKIHPYTSWIPILVFIVLRNIHPALRTRYIGLFAWLGKITLETYISQLHIYLQSNAKELIVYIPNHPLLNFALASAIFIFCSLHLFKITNIISFWLLPSATKELTEKVILTVALFFAAGSISFLITSGVGL